MTRVTIHLPRTTMSYDNLPEESINSIKASMCAGRAFVINREFTESFTFKKVNQEILFNPAMVTMVEITEDIDG